MDELRAGFRNLLSATGDRLKLALLIDGLDEFDEDHHDLVHLLSDTNAETGVRICASSRPWNIFRDAYSQNPKLQLENLTRDDIKAVVQDQLQLSPGYSDFATTHQQAAFKIITDIVDKSQGVFLWVSVISRLLRAALQDGTTISDLQTIIDNVPNEVADLFHYIWNRIREQFRAEASQYFRLMRFCQEHKTRLLALILWFGDKEFPVEFDTADVTTTYLTGVIKNSERKLMSRTGGLLELMSSNDNHVKRPEDIHVDFMHRTANDWVRDNWEMITLTTNSGFEPFFWFIKGQALRIVLTTKPNADNFEKLMDWPKVFNIASLVPEDHPDKEILVTLLDRLDDHMVSQMSKDHNPSGVYWANMFESPAESYFDYIRRGLTERFGPTTLSCTNLIELSARVPIPVYLKHGMEGNSNLLSTADYYVGILDNLVFGESWFPNISARLEILDFLIQEYRPRQEWLCMVRDRAEYARIIFSEEFSTNHQIYTHFTQVIGTLNSEITRIAWQPSRNGVAAAASIGGSSRTPATSDPRHQTPKPRFVHGLKDFSRKLFGRK